LHTIRRSAIYIRQHSGGGVGQKDSGGGAELQRRSDGQVEEKSNSAFRRVAKV